MAASCESYESAEWFFGPITRDETEDKLRGMPPGCFLVRESRTSRGSFVLSVSENCKISHYIITVQNGIYCIGEQSFQDLNQVVEFYKVHFLDTTTLTQALSKNSINQSEPPRMQPPMMSPRVTNQTPDRPSHQTSDSNDSLMGLQYVMKFDFEGSDPEDLPAKKGEILTLCRKEEDNWWLMKNTDGKQGLVPHNRMEAWPKSSNSSDIYKATTQSSGPLYARVTQQRIPTPYDKTNLRLEMGNIIKVTNRATSGQWEGEVISTGKQGSFPFRFVQILQGPELEEVLQSLPKNGPSSPPH